MNDAVSRLLTGKSLAVICDANPHCAAYLGDYLELERFGIEYSKLAGKPVDNPKWQQMMSAFAISFTRSRAGLEQARFEAQMKRGL